MRLSIFKARPVRALSHPAPEQFSLAAVLYALADPVRLDIVRELARAGEMSCANSCTTFKIARATLSRHYDVLRSAGLVHTRKDGVMYRNSLRLDELEQRFPGLLDMVLRHAQREQPAGE